MELPLAVTREGGGSLPPEENGALSPPISRHSGRIMLPFNRLSIADIRSAVANALRRWNADASRRKPGGRKARATGRSCRPSNEISPTMPYIPKASSQRPHGREELAFHQSHFPEPSSGVSSAWLTCFFVLGQPPSEGSAVDSLQEIGDRAGRCILFDQRLQGDDVSQTNRHRSKNSQQEYDRENARKIALAKQDEWKQAKQEDDASSRLAKKRECKKNARDPGDGNPQNAVDQPPFPEANCDQRRDRHPDTKLVTIFQKADGTEPE